MWTTSRSMSCFCSRGFKSAGGPICGLPRDSLAVALRANPAVDWYLRQKCPEVAPWLDDLPVIFRLRPWTAPGAQIGARGHKRLAGLRN